MPGYATGTLEFSCGSRAYFFDVNIQQGLAQRRDGMVCFARPETLSARFRLPLETRQPAKSKGHAVISTIYEQCQRSSSLLGSGMRRGSDLLKGKFSAQGRGQAQG